MDNEIAENEQRIFELKKLEFEKSLELRNFEIDNFWKRGWFFGAIIITLCMAFFNASQSYRIYIAFLGFLISFFQTLMNRGSKYWQERWENKTKHKESKLGIDVTKTNDFNKSEKHFLDITILAKNENWFTLSRRFSVSKLTILVWDIITLFAAFVWIKEWHIWGQHGSNVNWEAIIFQGLILLYIILFFFCKRKASENRNWRKSGGKVYEKFSREHNPGEHSEFADSRYYAESEEYINNKLKSNHPD